MKHIQLKVYCEPDFVEQLGAQFIEFGAIGVVEQLDNLDVYFNKTDFTTPEIMSQLSKVASGKVLDYTFLEVEDTNWNLLWESNYDPIEIENYCFIHAPFHEVKDNFKYSIEINPRMAFGTGHHETTHMMILNVAEVDVSGKTFLDLGCGTGILAIMASLEGAKSVTAIDIDENAVNTLKENFNVNKINNVLYLQGTIDTVINLSETYDVLFANINKNVLLKDAKKIVACTNKNGYIALSGFYTEDEQDIIEHYSQFGVQVLNKKSRNNWSSILFKRF